MLLTSMIYKFKLSAYILRFLIRLDVKSWFEDQLISSSKYLMKLLLFGKIHQKDLLRAIVLITMICQRWN